MRRPLATLATEVVAAVEVECTTCGVTMTSQLGSGGRVRYFHCAGCQRWSSSVYDEVLGGRAGMRQRAAPAEAATAAAEPGEVQARIAAWLRTLAPA